MISINGGGNDVSGAHGASGSSSTSPTGSGGLLKKGPWTAGEDEVLMQYVRAHGEGNWNAVQKHSGLNRCGKSCRLRWANHLRPNLKKGSFNQDEERLILELHSKYGNKWARMATQLPGRTDNEIKNYWNTRVKRRKRQGLPLYPNDINNNNNNNQQQYVHQLPSPTGITVTTPTPPTTPTNTFPFPSPQPIPFHHHHVTTPPPSHHHHHHSFDPPVTFSFQQHRPVPLLATPLARFKSYPPAHATSSSSSMLPPFVQYSPTGYDSSSALSSPVVVKTELPSNQFHHIVEAPLPEIQRIHNGGLLDDILENLLDEHHSCIHSSPELTPKEEPKEHINTLQEDLSKFLNFGPTSGTLAPQPVGPPHWYNSSSGGEIPTIQPDDNITIDVQHIAPFFPIVSSETATSASNYAQNPASWDSLPSICKGWYKQT